MRKTADQSEHPFPGEWNWWASYDGGEVYSVGPAASREHIIDLVIDDQLGEFQEPDGTWKIGAHIAECQDNHVDLAEWFDVWRFLEQTAEILEDNGCASNDDGESGALQNVTDDQEKDLEKRVRAAIRQWQKDHELKLRAWQFRHIRNEEDVVLPHPLDEVLGEEKP